VTALADHLGGEAERRIRLRFGRTALAVRGELGVFELREVLPEVRVRREAIVATVDLGDGERDALAGPRVERALAERTVQPEVALERGGAVGDDAEQVGDDAELLLDGREQRLRGDGGGFDRGGGLDA